MQNPDKNVHTDRLALSIDTRATRLPMLEGLKAEESFDWENFVRDYEKKIRSWLLQFGANANDADDLMQEVLIFVHSRLPKFEHNGRTGAFRRWLRQVTYNRFREHLKESQRRSAQELESAIVELTQPYQRNSHVLGSRTFSSLCEQSLDELSQRFEPQSIQVFRETVLRDRPIKEVASELKMTEVATRVAKSRVLRAFLKVARRKQEAS